MSRALPINRAEFSLAEITKATSGALLGGAPGERVRGVTTDSRLDATGQLFVPLRGERFDGHDFIGAAVERGASAVLIDRDVAGLSVPSIRVAETTRALLELAALHRSRWGGQLVAVAGSAGKTTTRSTISALLQQLTPAQTHFAEGNFNNRIGMPLVLLGLAPQHRYAVIEIGTNSPGEVAELSAVARPDAAVLTVIGLEHTEGLGTIDAIEAEEASLFAHLAPTGVAFGNVDDERVARRLAASSAARRVGYGFSAAADYRVVERHASSHGAELLLARPQAEPLRFACGLLGRAGAYASAAAVAVAETVLGRALVAGEVAQAFLAGAEPGRLTPLELPGQVLVLDDTYNSNPASLQSSVATAVELRQLRGGRLVLVLGEMRELGRDSAELHRQAGDTIADCGAELVVGVNGDARHLVAAMQRSGRDCLFAEDARAAARELLPKIRARDVVLVKASRGVRAELVVSELVRSQGAAP